VIFTGGDGPDDGMHTKSVMVSLAGLIPGADEVLLTQDQRVLMNANIDFMRSLS